MGPCPSKLELLHFLRDDSTPGPTKDLEAHVGDCPACRADLESLTGNAWLTGPGPFPKICGFDILELLGSGGMGRVYWARDLSLGREVAIKVLHERFGHDSEFRKRFLQEAAITSQLQHPCILPVHEQGISADGRPYLVMKLVQGRTLAELMDRRGDPSGELPRFLAIFRQICLALAYAHARGVLHRDLKPGNVMVGAFGEVYVTDWGLAKILQDHPGPDEALPPPFPEDTRCSLPGMVETTATQAIIGTLAYMAPEQARGDACDRRSDVFGLGAILFEILSGVPPFFRKEDAETYAAEPARQGDLAGAKLLLDQIETDEELKEIARKCLASDPADRPGDGEEVLREVDAYLEGVQERRRRAELVQAEVTVKSVEHRKRRGLRWALTVLSMVALIAGSGGYYWLSSLDHRQRSEMLRQTKVVAEALEAQPQLLDRFRWHEAKAVLRQARELQGNHPTPDLETSLREAERHLQLVVSFDRLLQDSMGAVPGDGKSTPLAKSMRRKGLATVAVTAGLDPAPLASAYERFFADLAIHPDQMSPDRTFTALRNLRMASRLGPGFELWALFTGKPAVRKWALEVADLTDPDPDRKNLRDPLLWNSPDKLVEKLQSCPSRKLTPSILFIAGHLLRGKTAPFVQRAMVHQANDFWSNLVAGSTLLGTKPNEASRYYQAALALRPDSKAALNNLGRARFASGDLDEALEIYSRGLALDPAFADFHMGKALVFRQRKQSDLFSSAVRQALDCGPDGPEAVNRIGLIALAIGGGELPFAVELFEILVRRWPDNAAYRFNLGVACIKLGQPIQAIVHLEDALRRNSRLVEAAVELAHTYREMGRPADAKKTLEKILQVAEGAAPPWFLLGVLRLEAGDAKGAVVALREALARDRHHSPSHLFLILAYDRLGDAEAAKRALREAPQSPNNPREPHDLALLLVRLDQLELAVPFFRMAIRFTPEDPALHHDLGCTLARLDRYPEALASLREAVSLDQDFGEAQAALGSLLLTIGGNLEEARKSLEKARDLLAPEDPARRFVLRCLGKINGKENGEAPR